MRLTVIRIESILKNLVQRMADERNRSLSDAVRDLIDLGIGYSEEGPVMFEGAFGISRSFSKLSFGDERTRISVWVDEEQIEKAIQGFQNSENGSIREAIRLGFIMYHADLVKIKGPRHSVQPFTGFKIKEFKNMRANKALERLSQSVK